MEIVRNRDLVAWLSGAIDGNQSVIDELVEKLTRDKGKMGMLNSHLSWSENAITAASRGWVFDQYRDKVVQGLDRHKPRTDAEFITFYGLVRQEALKALIGNSSNATNQSTLATSNLADQAKLEALSAIVQAVDWVLMDYESDDGA